MNYSKDHVVQFILKIVRRNFKKKYSDISTFI